MIDRIAFQAPAHPRVSGENPGYLELAFGLSGSSPRERGKRVLAHAKMFMPRLIPA